MYLCFCYQYFAGAESVNYRTVNQECKFDDNLALHSVFIDIYLCLFPAMEYKGSEMNFPKIKEEISAMKANLRKHNFNLGDYFH